MNATELPGVPSGPPTAAVFTSKLKEARERFLASIVDNAITIGRRSATDFLRAFSVREIMTALKDHPRLRANLIVSTTGVHEKIAFKKSADAASDDLELALSERVTNDDAVVALLDPDDRVRYLDHGRLWAFVADGEFWKNAEGPAAAIAHAHIGFILERARAEKLLSARDIVDGIGVDTLVEVLPRSEVARLVERALLEGRSGKPFKDEGVLEVLPLSRVLDFVKLAHVWERVIAPKLAYGVPAAAVPPAGPSVRPVPGVGASVVPHAPEPLEAEVGPVTDDTAALPSLEPLDDDNGELFVIDEGDEEVTANFDLNGVPLSEAVTRPTNGPPASEEMAEAAPDKRKSTKPSRRTL